MSENKYLDGVSIIIVSYNSEYYIIDCIESIKNNSKNTPYEIFVVDNASSDETVNIIEKKFSEVEIVKNGDNVGFARANNQAIKLAKYKYLFLLNPDTKFDVDVISTFYKFMERDDNNNIWCCGAEILDENFRPSNSYGQFTKLTKILFEQFGLGKIFNHSFNKKFFNNIVNLNDSPYKVPFILGADMFIRRDVLYKIGLFDEDFDLNFEEAELSFRASKNKYDAMIVPNAKIVHYGGKSFNNSEEQWLFYRKNEILFAQKCFSSTKYLLIHLIYVLGTLLRLIIKKNRYDVTLLKLLLNKKQRNFL